VVSENFSLTANDILGHTFSVCLEFPDETQGLFSRYFNGIATRFKTAGVTGTYAKYSIHLQSWFGLLTKRKNSRIFQDLEVREVLNQVISDSPITKVAFTNTKAVVGGPLKMTYCVQHQESDYHFLSRLFEREGIYYWFEAHGDEDIMYLSDASDLAHSETPAKDGMRFVKSGASDARFNEIYEWIRAEILSSGKYASRDTDFKAIRKKLMADQANPASHELADLEMFDFPGGYYAKHDLPKIGKLRQEEITASRRRSWALTSWPDVAVGKTFEFAGDKDMVGGNCAGEYLIASCTFIVTCRGYHDSENNSDDTEAGGEYLSIASTLAQYIADDAVNSGDPSAFAQVLEHFRSALTPSGDSQHQFLITVLPRKESFRPPRLTPQVVMPGPQSAIVVGTEGKEIEADDFGRVKVHFAWDRYDKSNESSSCWVRVSQPWAGNGWGGYFIPRIGQEVIVDFINGDPDRPIIMGRVYNDDQPLPFESHTQSGFISRSTPKGNADTFNMIMMEDLKDNEFIYVHAEKDHNTKVEHDQTLSVLNDRKKTVVNNEQTEIRGNRTEKVVKNESISIGGARTESVGGNETIHLHSSRETTIKTDENLTVGGDRGTEIKGFDGLIISGHRYTEIGKYDSLKISGSQDANIGDSRKVKTKNNDTIDCGKTLKITAGDEISLTTGSASITLKKDGSIRIEGTNILVKGSSSIKVKSDGAVKLTGSKITQN
jgi:type VI secretion system secreted protein VgrG